MTKTVNEIIKNEFKKIYKYNIVQFDNNVIEDLLHKILYAYKNEIAEKDKEHKEQFKIMYEQFKHDKEFEISQYKFKTEQQQLFKEDFLIVPDLNNRYWGYISKEKYDKLPSKDIK